MTLQDYIRAHSTEKRHNQEYWAAFFGISQGYLSEILNGNRLPSRGLIAEIASRTGGEVPASVWFEMERK